MPKVAFDSHVGDGQMVAAMKDIVERMALTTGWSVKWRGGDEKKKPSGPRRLSIGQGSIDQGGSRVSIASIDARQSNPAELRTSSGPDG
eukprot:4723027-Prymnesium_polylepis.1